MFAEASFHLSPLARAMGFMWGEVLKSADGLNWVSQAEQHGNKVIFHLLCCVHGREWCLSKLSLGRTVLRWKTARLCEGILAPRSALQHPPTHPPELLGRPESEGLMVGGSVPASAPSGAGDAGAAHSLLTPLTAHPAQ